ncbi:crossover junction endodeoxyribonuclease RuvC [Ehrlichia ruminantium]|uniref:crossover junction endodeoxyribonuclease RuvC n=1 Tax=Ehrlichia ruminantium TaxID=779 RepID=UPI00130EA082|nr:crossover junction endodeoxyribonuclease RuvC [Ehrlichia ruminantium]QGR02105.1 crossover junction endodeoxyribonuclease RuvC [Ehrlichia ruminantium]
MNIIGIDPSLNCTGWAVLSVCNDDLNKIHVVNNGAISTNSKETIGQRLYKIHNEFLNIIDSYKVNIASIEEVFINKNPKSSISLCYARGTILLTLSITNTPLFEYSANRVKKSITGNGHAKKEQVCFMVENILGIKCCDIYDISDAMAVAICHIYSMKIITEKS